MLPARNEADRPAAVIDVGSNSIRLVVYDALSRAPVAIFNERAPCRLARELDLTGRLDGEGIEIAKRALARFSTLADEMDAVSTDVVATAAVREAADGQDFVAQVKRDCGLSVRVLSGPEEARFSAMGVALAAPGAEGLMGDLGGGSLELVSLEPEAERATTLPLGTLRMGETRDEAARAEVDGRLREIDWISGERGKCLYVVGGAWRALGHLHMLRKDHPLLVLHGYRVGAAEMRETAMLTAGLSRASTRQLKQISADRRATLPYASRVLASVIETSGVDEVAFSAFGLREGVMMARLSAREREADPLLVGCARLARDRARFPDIGPALAAWTGSLFPDETPAFRRLREAAALLADGAWMTHPDYRAEQAMLETARGPFIAINHNERARLALMVHARHTGRAVGPAVAEIRRLVDDSDARDARRTGQALRLGLTFTGGLAALLEGVRLKRTESRLELTVPRARRALAGDLVLRRFEALARAFELTPALIVGD